MLDKRLIIIKASAGSGKTYRLSQKYINLLKNYIEWKRSKKDKDSQKRRGLFCSESSLFPDTLDSVVAITFTNKAAAEMRQRVLRFLKEIIRGEKGEKQEFFLTQDEATEVLIDLIENFSDFQITTIDSFMNKIFKAFAVEFNIYPDYEITFDKNEIFSVALNEYFLSENRQELIDFLKVLLKVEKTGFDGERIIRKALEKYKESSLDVCSGNIVLAKDVVFGLLKNSFAGLFKQKCTVEEIDTAGFFSAESFESAVSELRKMGDSALQVLKGIVENYNDFFNGKRTKWIKNATDLKNLLSKGVSKLSLWKAEDAEYYLKSKSKLPFEVESRFNNALYSLKLFIKAEFVFNAVYEGISTARVFCNVLTKENEIKKSLNIVEGGNIAERLKMFLNRQMFPYAFCLLGEKVKHYLIDEFQDTSDLQLYAMAPLIENALAGGGSLFVVGDKKQAIYGWRGGDYRVFDIIENSDDYVSFSEIAGGVNERQIKENYRSAKEIVEFNNDIFRKLEGASFPESLVSFVFNEEIDKENGSPFADELRKVYGGVCQEAKSREKGYVSVKLAAHGEKNKEFAEEFYKSEFNKVFTDILSRFDFRDIMILGRSKEDLQKIIEFLFEFEESYGKSVPFITEDSLKLLGNENIKNLLLFASFCLNPYDVALFKALGENGFFPIENPETFFEKVYSLEKSGIALDNFKSILSETVENGEDFGDKVLEAINLSSSLSPYEFFIALFSLFPEFRVNENKAYFDRFLETVLNLSDRGLSLFEIIEYFYKNKDITVSMPENINAVRIMTIHKAKGLEAKVVFIPFYKWDMVKTDSGELVPLELNDVFPDAENIVFPAKVDSHLRTISPVAEKIYRSKKERIFIESLNLMYVANTRAERELYIRGCFPLTSKGEISRKTINAAAVLSILANGMLDEKKEHNAIFYICEKGEKTKPCKKDLKEKREGEREFEFSPSVRRELTVAEDFETVFHVDKRKAGDIFHLAMSFLDKFETEKQLADAVSESFLKAIRFYGEEPEKFSQVEIMMKKAVSMLADYFIDVERVWNEKEIIAKEGLIFRIDRLVLKNGQFFVIDYKTGEKDLEKHKKQIKNYLSILKKGRISAKGLIYYAAYGEVINV